jgi:phosphopantetheinyl transferase
VERLREELKRKDELIRQLLLLLVLQQEASRTTHTYVQEHRSHNGNQGKPIQARPWFSVLIAHLIVGVSFCKRAQDIATTMIGYFSRFSL